MESTSEIFHLNLIRDIVMTTKNKLLAKIDETNDKVSRSPILKGLLDGGLSIIPGLGSAISSSLDARSFQLFEENSRKFAEEVHRLIESVDENKLKDKLVEVNKIIVKTEEQQIEEFISRHGWSMDSTGTGLRYMIYEKGNGKNGTAELING